MDRPVRRALLSVFDKDGILELGQALAAAGVELLSSGGTARLLSENGVAVTTVPDYTGFPEMLDGRVRWVASEAMFTPYFALTERDRGHLTYAAKIDIETDGERLPDGIPVSVEL